MKGRWKVYALGRDDSDPYILVGEATESDRRIDIDLDAFPKNGRLILFPEDRPPLPRKKS